jgi:acyl-CoA thioesterase YciA
MAQQNSTSTFGDDELDENGLPRYRQAELRVVAMPKDANPAGDIFGGWIMSHVDVAGGIAAMRAARGRVVTVAVNSFTFKQPVAIGDLVSFYAKVIRTGTTSVTVDVEVVSQRWAEFGRIMRVTEAVLTYVAVDAKGNKRPLEGTAGAGDA